MLGTSGEVWWSVYLAGERHMANAKKNGGERDAVLEAYRNLVSDLLETIAVLTRAVAQTEIVKDEDEDDEEEAAEAEAKVRGGGGAT
jgi:hypothetical protein